MLTYTRTHAPLRVDTGSLSREVKNRPSLSFVHHGSEYRPEHDRLALRSIEIPAPQNKHEESDLPDCYLWSPVEPTLVPIRLGLKSPSDECVVENLAPSLVLVKLFAADISRDIPPWHALAQPVKSEALDRTQTYALGHRLAGTDMLSAPNQFVDDDSSPESSVYESTYESESVYESAIEESQSEGFLTPTLVLGSPPSTDSELWDDGTTINDGSTIQ